MKKALRETQILRAAYADGGPSSISVPNLKRIAEFVQKLLKAQNVGDAGARPLGRACLTPSPETHQFLSSVTRPNLVVVGQPVWA